MRVAKASDWRTLPLPERRSTVALDRAFSADEMERLRAGAVPSQMEDKWFVYWQDERLYFHRSWTGYCVYVVSFRELGGAWRMVQADLNRDPEQYRETDDQRDARLVSYVIDAVLLGRVADFPASGDPTPASALAEWSLVGRAMTGGGAPDHDAET